MTVISPPLYQTVDGVYTGAHLGIPFKDFLSEGVVATNDLKVSQRGAGANMSVDVAAGVAWISGDDNTATQPLYRCYNDGTVNVAIAAADGSQARVDRVIAEVRDSSFSGVSQDWRIRVITGTPSGSPSAPSIPANAISLATVSVPAADTTISDAQITDTRPRAHNLRGAGPACRAYRATAQTIPNASFTSVQFDNEHFDTGDMHSNSVNNTRFTVPLPGIYAVNATAYFVNTGGGGVRAGQWVVNNSYGIVQVYDWPGANETSLNLHTVAALNAGDYLELKLFQTSGGGLNAGATDSAGQFLHASVVMLSALHMKP